MGQELSSCCSVEASPDKQVIKDQGAEGGTGKDRAATPVAAVAAEPTKAEVEKFQRRLEDSMDVIVLLADGTRLACQLKLNTIENTLAISCEKNLRIIPLNELRAVLHGKDQLRRVETKANLVEDPQCLALHMSTGNCIPMRFETVQDQQCFIILLKGLKAQG
eukprot:Trichotokara_eunicae@DN2782_c0_g1_i1.p1